MNVEIFGLSMNAFTAALSAALLISLAAAVIQLRGTAFPVRVIDALLPALVIGYALARIEHVILQWNYFSAAAISLREWVFPTYEGGLGWHGALIGGFFGLWIGARWQRIAWGRLIAAFAPALPLIALGGWAGCAAVGCGYGIEVDTLARYSPVLVHEARDIFGIVAPRFATQAWGIVLAFVVVLVLYAPRGKTPTLRRVFIGVAVLSGGMFVIGLLRADSVVYWSGVRADQGLDLIVSVWGLVSAAFQPHDKLLELRDT